MPTFNVKLFHTVEVVAEQFEIEGKNEKDVLKNAQEFVENEKEYDTSTLRFEAEEIVPLDRVEATPPAPLEETAGNDQPSEATGDGSTRALAEESDESTPREFLENGDTQTQSLEGDNSGQSN